MSREGSLQSILTIKHGGLNHRSPGATQFSFDQATANGPTPGSRLIATAGTTIDLSELVALGGMAEFTNLDPTNKVTWGVYVGGSTWVPVGDILPGERYVLRLSADLLHGASGTAHANDLRFKAHVAACYVQVNVFDF